MPHVIINTQWGSQFTCYTRLSDSAHALQSSIDLLQQSIYEAVLISLWFSPLPQYLEK